MGKGEHPPIEGSPELGMTLGCHTHREAHAMASQLRKSHSSLDGSQVGKLRPREKVICPGPSSSITHPGTSCLGGAGVLTWVAFPERQEVNDVQLQDHLSGCTFHCCFASEHCPGTCHQVGGSQSLGRKAAPSDTDRELHSPLLAQSPRPLKGD